MLNVIIKPMKRDETKKTYWKSLEELHQDPEFLEQSKDEFPESAPNRRDFLKLMGFSVTAASLAACSRSPVYKAIAYLDKPVDTTPGVANYYATTCAGCEAVCGLLAKTRDGRPIKIEGNPESPINTGSTCATGQASVLSLYDGARLQGPQLAAAKSSWNSIDKSVREGLQSAVAAGKKIALLTGTLMSPTTRQLISEFTAHYTNAEHITYDPVSVDAIYAANQENFGKAVIPSYLFDKANVIVGVNADFLNTWISPVEFTQRYSKGRKLGDKSEMSRHVQFESYVSLTGSNADQRVGIQPSQQGLVLWGLLAEIARLAGGASVPTPDLSGLDAAFIKKTAHELWKSRGESLVVSGSNDVAHQRLCNAINAQLGNVGRTIDLDNPIRRNSGTSRSIQELVADMQKGEVGALIIYGVNPAYDYAEAEKFKEGLKKVKLSVSLDPYRTETAALSKVLAPDLHYLEAWNDAEAKANLFHLTQPTIAPLYNTRAAQDSLLKWMGKNTDYYHYLKDAWKSKIFSQQSRFASFKSFWDRALHDGGVAFPAQTPRHHAFSGNVSSSIAQVKGQQGKGGYELYLYEKVGVRDGRHANNPWLQELPDPVSKVTWDNYANMAPEEASRLGLKQGDMIRLSVGNRKIKLPVYLQPGHPVKTISAALGYGRKQAGKVGNNVGGNLYPFVTLTKESFIYHSGGLDVSKSTGRHKLAVTQTHNSMEGRPIIKETTLPAYQANPKSGNEDKVHLVSLWPEHKYTGQRWGMAIDLNACTGCSSCVVSCQAENNVPVVGQDEVYRRREMHWIRIDRYYSGTEENPDVAHQPMMCQHCANAPCETVCPVLATVHSSDGLNQQVYNRCVGTRYCANNCPYKVRRFNWFNYADNDKFDYNMNSEIGKMVLNPDIVVRSRGVMEKCSMCIQRIQEGKLKARDEGRKVKDGDIQMACQQSCPSDAIVFGDLSDPKSRISKLVKNDRYYRVLEELNVQPVVGYLTKVRNIEKG